MVTAQGAGSAAGIGGGCGDYTTDGHSRWGRCGNIIINGGQVTARGGDETAGIGPGFSLLGSNSGKLTLGWTNAQEDFIYCSGFKSGSNYYGKITLNSITFAEGKQFVIDGTATIATSSNIGGKKIVPYTTEQLPLSGAGTLENPWRITSAADWNVLAQNIIAGNSYSGEYVQLDADIEIAGGVGGHDENGVNGRPFSGTFLGNNKTITAAFSSFAQGAAPFRYISGATIKNLTVAGTITSDQYYTSGLVGFADGENLIEGCIVSATINQNSDYAGGSTRTATTPAASSATARPRLPPSETASSKAPSTAAFMLFIIIMVAIGMKPPIMSAASGAMATRAVRSSCRTAWRRAPTTLSPVCIP